MRIDDVRMVLAHFDYDFRCHGKEDGLQLTTWIFEPRPDRGEGGAEMRDAVMAAADLHRELLDRVFADVLKGRSRPVLSDRPDGRYCSHEPSVASGYQYVGRLTWRGRRRLGRRLRRLFGDRAGDPPGDLWPRETYYANIGLASGEDHGPSDLHLWVTHDLSHAVNAALFRHLRGLDAFGLHEKAAARVARLDRLLDAGGPDGDGHAVPPGPWRPSRDPLVPPPSMQRSPDPP